MTAATNGPPVPGGVLLGLFAMMIGNFMALLDIQIVASAIGAIQAGVSATRDEVSWVQTSYLIAEVIGIPLSGFLARAMGTRLLFCTSSVLFTISSLLCSLSWDISSLVVFRTLQGFSGAAMVPLTLGTLHVALPRERQAMAMSMAGMISMLAPTIGPTFGGYIAETLGWRALFWINVAPGLFATAAVWLTLRDIDKPRFDLFRRLDVAGLVGMALFLGAAEYVLEEGAGAEWFASGEIWFWSLASVLGAAVFFWRGVTSSHPIVDLRPFSQPVFSVAIGLTFIMGMCLFSGSFLLPVFLGSVRGYNALQIGETMFTQGAVMLALGPVMGVLLRGVTDTRWMGALGFLLLGVSCFYFGGMTAETGLQQLWFPQALRGIGLLLMFTSIMQPALQSLPPDQVHAGSGIYATMRNIGGAFGIAGLTTLQHHAYALHRQELYAAADPANPHVQAMIQGSQAYLEQAGASDPARQAVMHYASLLDREALVMTFNDQFLILGVITGAAAFAVLLLRPARDGAAPRPPVGAH
jgi:DHA2 family multidrug resistance protein